MQNKEKIIEELKQKCNERLAFFKENKKKTLIFSTISSFLKDGEDFFMSCKSETAINILLDLGYEKEKAKELYLKLICQK